jgi:hypothetical protein
LWLRREPPPSGNESLDELIRKSMEGVEGFALKTKTQTTTRRYNRKRTKVKGEQKSVSETNVDKIEKQNIKGSIFLIPKDYERVQMPGQDGMPSLGDIFKRN